MVLEKIEQNEEHEQEHDDDDDDDWVKQGKRRGKGG
ncbi:uncharacterized protein G2W53_006096 [Senna tora]|uniref:Uncharacterized protein n=1 Tax=Senna tora TaxID=362788 RepID=A0A835CCK4_9FABA|nr:uncharacterized protein G2W53_006096 [Senna tora]